MPFLDLEFNLTALRKLAERGLSAEDVTDVFRVSPVVTTPNPNPRAEGSLLAIGPSRAGRFITVVVEPDADADGRWHARSAWTRTRTYA